jgi:hypothetical protein
LSVDGDQGVGGITGARRVSRSQAPCGLVIPSAIRRLAKWTARTNRSSYDCVWVGPSAVVAYERLRRRRPSGTLVRGAAARARSCRSSLTEGSFGSRSPRGAQRIAPCVLPGIHTLPPPRPWGEKTGKCLTRVKSTKRTTQCQALVWGCVGGDIMRASGTTSQRTAWPVPSPRNRKSSGCCPRFKLLRVSRKRAFALTPHARGKGFLKQRDRTDVLICHELGYSSFSRAGTVNPVVGRRTSARAGC